MDPLECASTSDEIEAEARRGDFPDVFLDESLPDPVQEKREQRGRHPGEHGGGGDAQSVSNAEQSTSWAVPGSTTLNFESPF